MTPTKTRAARISLKIGFASGVHIDPKEDLCAQYVPRFQLIKIGDEGA
jgi:hypothetical protein